MPSVNLVTTDSLGGWGELEDDYSTFTASIQLAINLNGSWHDVDGPADIRVNGVYGISHEHTGTITAVRMTIVSSATYPQTTVVITQAISASKVLSNQSPTITLGALDEGYDEDDYPYALWAGLTLSGIQYEAGSSTQSGSVNGGGRGIYVQSGSINGGGRAELLPLAGKVMTELGDSGSVGLDLVQDLPDTGGVSCFAGQPTILEDGSWEWEVVNDVGTRMAGNTLYALNPARSWRVEIRAAAPVFSGDCGFYFYAAETMYQRIDFGGTVGAAASYVKSGIQVAGVEQVACDANGMVDIAFEWEEATGHLHRYAKTPTDAEWTSIDPVTGPVTVTSAIVAPLIGLFDWGSFNTSPYTSTTRIHSLKATIGGLMSVSAENSRTSQLAAPVLNTLQGSVLTHDGVADSPGWWYGTGRLYTPWIAWESLSDASFRAKFDEWDGHQGDYLGWRWEFKDSENVITFGDYTNAYVDAQHLTPIIELDHPETGEGGLVRLSFAFDGDYSGLYYYSLNLWVTQFGSINGGGLTDTLHVINGGGLGWATQSGSVDGGGVAANTQSDSLDGGAIGQATEQAGLNSGAIGEGTEGSSINSGGFGYTIQSDSVNGGGIGEATEIGTVDGGGIGEATEIGTVDGGGIGEGTDSDSIDGAGFGHVIQADAIDGGGIGGATESGSVDGGGCGATVESNSVDGGGLGTATQSESVDGGGIGEETLVDAINGGGYGYSEGVGIGAVNGGGVGQAGQTGEINGAGYGHATQTGTVDGGGCGVASSQGSVNGGGLGFTLGSGSVNGGGRGVATGTYRRRHSLLRLGGF